MIKKFKSQAVAFGTANATSVAPQLATSKRGRITKKKGDVTSQTLEVASGAAHVAPVTQATQAIQRSKKDIILEFLTREQGCIVNELMAATSCRLIFFEGITLTAFQALDLSEVCQIQFPLSVASKPIFQRRLPISKVFSRIEIRRRC